MNLPETVTPWLVLGTTFLAFLAALGGASLWTWRRVLWPTFVGGVMDAVGPLQLSLDNLSETIARTDKSVEAQLSERSVVVNQKFEEIAAAHASIGNRLTKLELRQSRDTQKVVTAVQEAATPPAPSDAA